MNAKTVDKRRESAILKQQMPSAGQKRAPITKPQVDPVLERAKEVIGSEEKALRWLGTPVRALNYATPISLLGTREGKEAVLAVLERAEYGVF